MGLIYEDLDEVTRGYMVEEIDHDIASGTLYISPWLTDVGASNWPTLLRNASQFQDDDWLANQLRQNGRVRETAERRKPKGVGMVTYRVPFTAFETIAEGEFNRFYVRGLCLRAIAEGVSFLEVYRGKAVREPRPGSEEKIGTLTDPKAVLEDLRTTVGVEPALGVPPGPNSGLTVKLHITSSQDEAALGIDDVAK